MSEQICREGAGLRTHRFLFFEGLGRTDCYSLTTFPSNTTVLDVAGLTGTFNSQHVSSEVLVRWTISFENPLPLCVWQFLKLAEMAIWYSHLLHAIVGQLTRGQLLHNYHFHMNNQELTVLKCAQFLLYYNNWVLVSMFTWTTTHIWNIIMYDKLH